MKGKLTPLHIHHEEYPSLLFKVLLRDEYPDPTFWNVIFINEDFPRYPIVISKIPSYYPYTRYLYCSSQDIHTLSMGVIGSTKSDSRGVNVWEYPESNMTGISSFSFT